jgi:hypothetical protein
MKEAQRVGELAPVEILHDGVDDDQVERSAFQKFSQDFTISSACGCRRRRRDRCVADVLDLSARTGS